MNPEQNLSKPIRVLICEDTTITRTAMVIGLSHMDGLAVVGEAEHGEHAVAAVSLHQPDVVLMDIRMPKMDGIEATRQIKQNLPLTKVLVMSALPGHDWQQKAMDAGADGYCTKSIHPKRLYEEIVAVLSGSH